MRARQLGGYGLLVVTALGWSGAWITARLAAHDAPAMTVTVGRFAIAAVALLPAWMLIDRGKETTWTRRDVLLVLGMSLTGITTYTVLFLTGVALAPATDGAIVTPGFVGLFAIAFAWAFAGQRPGRAPMFGALLALAGSGLVGYNALTSAGIGSTRIAGDLVFVAAAAAYGAYTVLGERLSTSIPPVTSILAASALGAILLAPLALAVDGVPDLAGWSWRAWLNVVYLGLVATAISFVTYYAAVHAIGIGATAPALGLVPLFATVGANLLLDEPLTWLHAAGALLVVAGILLPPWARRRSTDATAAGEG